MCDKSSSEYGVRIVPAVTFEASRLIRDVAPAKEGENVKSRIAKAATALRWKWSRTRAIWTGDARIRVRAEELDQLRAFKVRQQVKAGNNELEELRDTIARLAERLDRIDPDFHGPSADALRDQIRRLDGTSGPVDRT